MASLGANVTIPDQVVLVGGTGKHLSDRFSFVHDENAADYTVRLSNGARSSKNPLQGRLGPRRYEADDEPDDPYLDGYGGAPRPHVLKRLGQPYNPWRTDQSAFEQSSRGRPRGGRYSSGYAGNYYGAAPTSRYNGGGGSSYNYYKNSGYGGGGAAYVSPYPNYGGYSKPRYNNYSYYNPYQYRGGGGYQGAGNYRGRFNSYAPRSRGGRRGGRYNRHNDVSEKDLDRELDEYRQGKKDDGNMA
ncbi:hypothetical protein BV898_10554 [Hypsibius exemplaris]|uniref:Uncharacterized protein n=1 Tax=Hypsibius exemplaris TaxID=2072580 RepID=A0A1W0WJD1_HYPEX|nr:hypothetical protein BV898_10554 [Hypsibius exemplaris]